MLVTPFGIASLKGGGTGTAPTAVTLISAQPISVQTSTTNWSSLSIPLTGTTGNLLVMLASYVQADDATCMNNVTWAGDAMTTLENDGFDRGGGLVGGAWGWSGWIRGGAVNGTLACTANDEINRDLIGWVLSFDRMAVAPIGASEIVFTHIEQAAQSIGITPTNSLARVYGLIAAISSNAYPMTANSPWTILGQGRTGTGGGTDVAAMLANHPSPSSGTPLTLTGTAPGSFTTNDWFGLAAEVLPA